MFSRPVFIGAIGAVVVIAAILLNYVLNDESAVDQEVAAVAPSSPVSESQPKSQPAPPPVAAAQPEKSTSTAPADKPAAPASSEEADDGKPSFDVVRIDPKGNLVLAGRAKPNAKVKIREGDKILGEAQADARGDWVFIPETRLAPGDRVLSLSTEDADGGTSESDKAVVVVIPEEGKDIAGNVIVEGKPADRTPLAMVVPRDPASEEASKVVQAPAAPAAAPTVEAPKSGDSRQVVKVFPTQPQQAAAGASASGDEAAPPVSLDSVDYDDKGKVVLSGRSEPGSQVQVYVDNRLAGQVTAGQDGRWTLSPKGNVEPGTHNLRVDRVTDVGKVLARVELPFMRAQPFTGLPSGAVVIIQPGNNLWRIASRVYGDGLRYTEIYQANADQIRDPDLIYPGQVFGLPRTN